MNALAKQALSALFSKDLKRETVMTSSNVHQFVERRNVDRRKTNNPTLSLPAYVPSVLSAVEIVTKFGITRNQINSLLINQFHYPEQYRNTLEEYFVRHWEGSHFDKMIKDGTLVQGETSYLVVYQNCSPYVVKNASQVKLSFRKPLGTLGLQAYVLVKLHQDSKGNNNNGNYQ